MDFCVRLGANHSDSGTIARICNDVWREKTRFYVPTRVKHYTRIPVGPQQVVGFVMR